MEKNLRSCNWLAVLYPDDPSHSAMIDSLSLCGYDFAAILHDSDIDDSGQLKKPHFHVVLCFPYQKTASAVSKLFGVAENYFRKCADKPRALRYLQHLDDPDKFQYPDSAVFGTIPIPNITDNLSETEQVLCILDLLDSLPVPISYARLLRECCHRNLYPTLRRMGSGAVKLLDEHNCRDVEARLFEDRAGKSFVSYSNQVEHARFAGFCEGHSALVDNL